MQNPVTQSIQPHQHSERYTRSERLGVFGLGVLLLVLLIVAFWLQPNPAGLGTHTQLGLPGCTMVTLLGIRCPGCGMTTSWAYALKGDLTSAIRANVGGVLLCFLAMATFPFLMWIGIRGRPFETRWFTQVAVTVLLIAIFISIVEWLIRLAA
jgi:hypothetical protein